MSTAAPSLPTAQRWHPSRRMAGSAVQFGSFVFILGVPEGILGVLWPTMRHSLHRPLADLGELVVAGTVLYFAGGLLANRIERTIGLRATLVVSTVGGTGSLLLWAFGPSWWTVIAAIALLGGVKGVLDAALNAVAAIDGGVRRLGLLHASWAIGGTLGPVVVATVVAGSDWRAAVALVAVIAGFLIPLAALSPSPPVPLPATEPEIAAATAATAGTRPNNYRQWVGLAATTFAFMMYTAAEGAPVSWGATYLVSDRHLHVATAAAAMAAFWGALTLGRLALALPQRWRPTQLLEASCLLFVAGTALVWALPGILAVVGLAVAGLGSAAIFPLYIALTPARLGADVTGRAVGYSIAGSSLGGPAAVSLFGVLAAHFGVSVLGPCLFGAAVLMYLSHRLLAALVRPGPRATSLVEA